MRTPPSGPPAPPTLPLDAALSRSEPLGRLMQRLRESNECLDAVRTLLPDGLADEVRAGPLDDKGWTLLVAGSSAAAKLRQLLPRIEAELLASRQRVITVRVKILPPVR